MSYAIARVGDSITGSCTGTYDKWISTEHGGYYRTYTETGYVTGYIESGSSITFDQGKSIARVGDRVRIYKHYSHSNHNDSLEVTGTITNGSSVLFDQGKAIAYFGSEVSASGCSNVTINSGSNILFTSN